jgi:hypothetical protein
MNSPQQYCIRFTEVHTYEVKVDADNRIAAMAAAMAHYQHMPYATSVEYDGCAIEIETPTGGQWVELGLTEAEEALARSLLESGEGAYAYVQGDVRGEAHLGRSETPR